MTRTHSIQRSVLIFLVFFSIPLFAEDTGRGIHDSADRSVCQQCADARSAMFRAHLQNFKNWKVLPEVDKRRVIAEIFDAIRGSGLKFMRANREVVATEIATAGFIARGNRVELNVYGQIVTLHSNGRFEVK